MTLTKHYTMAKNYLSTLLHAIISNSNPSQSPFQNVAGQSVPSSGGAWAVQQSEMANAVSKAAQAINGGTFGTTTIYNPNTMDYEHTDLHFSVRKVANGYTMQALGKTYIASNIEELKDLFTTEMVKHALEKK